VETAGFTKVSNLAGAKGIRFGEQPSLAKQEDDAMSVSQSFGAAVDSAIAANPALDNTGAAPPQQGDPGQGVVAAPQQGQPAPEGDKQPGFVGFKPAEQPAATPGANGAPAPDGGKWKLADGVAPDLVVAHDAEGKPITAAEVQSGYMRTNDYTQKSQELAGFKERANLWDTYIQENGPILEKLDSNDPATVKDAIFEIARMYGVDLGAGSARDAQGRFVSTNKPAVDLEALKTEYGETSPEYLLAVRNNELEGQIAELQKGFGDFKTAQERATAQAQAGSVITQIASEWSAGGFNADVNGAFQLIGQPITAEAAMILHNYEALMNHNVRVARAQGGNGSLPNEPGGAHLRTKVDPSGLSFSQFVDKTVHTPGQR
jgi:hypothetical protein